MSRASSSGTSGPRTSKLPANLVPPALDCTACRSALRHRSQLNPNHQCRSEKCSCVWSCVYGKREVVAWRLCLSSAVHRQAATGGRCDRCASTRAAGTAAPWRTPSRRVWSACPSTDLTAAGTCGRSDQGRTEWAGYSAAVAGRSQDRLLLRLCLRPDGQVRCPLQTTFKTKSPLEMLR